MEPSQVSYLADLAQIFTTIPLLLGGGYATYKFVRRVRITVHPPDDPNTADTPAK